MSLVHKNRKAHELFELGPHISLAHENRKTHKIREIGFLTELRRKRKIPEIKYSLQKDYNLIDRLMICINRKVTSLRKGS